LRFKKITYIFIFASLFLSNSAIASNSFSILVVHAYSQEYPWTRGQHEGFVENLNKLLPISPEIKTEYLDTKRIKFDTTYAKQYLEFIRNKYTGLKFDAIYVTDDNGLLFAINSLSKIYPETPIFFSGVNDYSVLSKLNSNKETGVFEKKEIAPNLQLIEKLFKHIKKVFIVGDTSNTYAAIKVEIERQLKGQQTWDVHYISSNVLSEISSAIQKDKKSIVLLTTIGAMKDDNGKLLPIEKTIQQISEMGNEAVISMEDAYLFNGILGGYVTRGVSQGKSAAQLMLSFFEGTPISSISPITSSPNEYIFDDRELEQKNLILPEEIALKATILHPRLSVYQFYRKEIIATVILLTLALITTIIVYSLVTNRKNNELKKQAALLRLQGKKLQESEEKYRLLFERSEDPMLVIRKYKFALANHAAARLLGYEDQTHMLKVSPSSLSPEFQADGLLSVEKANEMMNIAYLEGYHRFEWLHLKKDGKELLIEVSLTRIPFGEEYALFCVWRDITQWRKAEVSLREKTIYLDSLLSASSNVGFIATDEQLNINYYNDAAANVLGIKSDDLERQNIRFFHKGLANDQNKGILLALKQAKDKGEYRFSMTLRPFDAEKFIDARISPILDECEQLNGYLLMVEDVTKQHEAEELIKFQATYDQLTHLPNRRTLLELLEKTLSNCIRHHHFGTILYTDLDNFKTINDTLGHPIGDKLLQQVATRMINSIRSEDTVARLGGDEFVVLLAETGDDLNSTMRVASQVAKKLIRSIETPFFIEQNEIRTSISIGITHFPVDDESVDDIFRKADTALYQAKDKGRNTFKFFLPEMQEQVESRIYKLNKLRQAIENGELTVYFQPQNNSQGKLIGIESLVRWQHTDGEITYPNEFIPLAEESGLIEPIGEFVLRLSLETQLRWQQENFSDEFPKIAVNLSAYQFQNKKFIENFRNMIADTGADPSMLKFELTESMLVTDVENTIEKINCLKKLGVSFSIDDFGTGYSSLSYLKKLPIDELKIDRAFIKDILTDSNDSALVNMILSLAKQLEMRVIAEGVESKQIFDALVDKGCQCFQGYYFNKPMPIKKFEQKYFKNQSNI